MPALTAIPMDETAPKCNPFWLHFALDASRWYRMTNGKMRVVAEGTDAFGPWYALGHMHAGETETGRGSVSTDGDP